MYPNGHARCDGNAWESLLTHKFRLMAAMSSEDPEGVLDRLSGLEDMSAESIAGIYSFAIRGLDL